MGTLLRPVGPLPANVYWVRRAFLLVAVLVVVFTVVQLLPSGGDPNKAAADPGAKPSASSSAKPTGTASPEPGGTGAAASTQPETEPTTSAAAVRMCTDADITVSTRTDARVYPAGVRPRLTLVVTNTSDTACRRDLGSKPLTLLVTSGGHRMWSSDDCASSSRSALKVLEPGKEFTSAVSWARLTSAAGCPSSARHEADPGTYVVSGQAGKVKGGSAVFSLR